MSASEWIYDTGAVLTDSDGRWWHIIGRYRNVDTNERHYELADATHTEHKEIDGDYLERQYDSAGWRTSTKPAAERGYRVNGVLCGPSDVDHYKGNKCDPERECPDCGVAGLECVDVIVDNSGERAYCECRECGHEWELEDE